jgi:hypothetical protein
MSLELPQCFPVIKKKELPQCSTIFHIGLEQLIKKATKDVSLYADTATSPKLKQFVE